MSHSESLIPLQAETTALREASVRLHEPYGWDSGSRRDICLSPDNLKLNLRGLRFWHNFILEHLTQNLTAGAVHGPAL